MRTAQKASGQAIAALLDGHAGEIERFALQVVEKFHQGRRLFLLGDGPQAAIASLVATVFQHRLAIDRPPLPVMPLCHDVFLLGSLGRAGAGREFFSRQLRAVGAADDIVLVFADGQRAEALVEALDTARQQGCITAVVTPGEPDTLGEPPDYLFPLEGAAPRASEASLFFGHLLCELVEKELFGI